MQWPHWSSSHTWGDIPNAQSCFSTKCENVYESTYANEFKSLFSVQQHVGLFLQSEEKKQEKRIMKKYQTYT